MSSNEGKIRRPKPDAADAQDTGETFLPGQIPVAEAESRQGREARATEQQPDPAAAAQAVNPEFLSEVDPQEPIENPEIVNSEDRNKGE